MSWDPVANPDDYAMVDGVIAPGVCTLTKLSEKRRLLKVEPYGALGARVISLGKYLVEFAFTVSLPTEAEWLLYPAFRTALNRIPVGARGKAFSIKWAPLNVLGVTAFLPEEIEGPLPDETGNWVLTVTGTQWVPIPKPALSAPKEAEKPAAPTDPVDKIIEDLANRVRTHADQ